MQRLRLKLHLGRLVERLGCCRGVVHLLPGNRLWLDWVERRLGIDWLGVARLLAVEPGLHRRRRVLHHDNSLLPPHTVAHVSLVAGDNECGEV